jgi:hypothetical protein
MHKPVGLLLQKRLCLPGPIIPKLGCTVSSIIARPAGNQGEIGIKPIQFSGKIVATISVTG